MWNAMPDWLVALLALTVLGSGLALALLASSLLLAEVGFMMLAAVVVSVTVRTLFPMTE